MRLRSAGLGVVATIALAGAACSTSPELSTTSTEAVVATTTVPPTTSTTSTTLPPTTSTTSTIPALLVSDAINGLPIDDPSSMDRRVVAIKIDNHPYARPQSGLMEADAVYEILVEGGYTRFITMFHQSDLDWVGPIRSGRPTDINVIKPLDAAFQISGAQKYVIRMFRDDELNMVYDNGVTTWREDHRNGPHNLYTSSLLVRDWADAEDWPDENPGNLFTFGTPATTTDQAHVITFDWSGQPKVVWRWSGIEYLRFNEAEPHGWVDQAGNEGVVRFPTLLAIIGTKYTVNPPPTTSTSTSTTTTVEGAEPTPPPPPSKAPTSVPAIDLVGTGEAILFHDGIVVRGTWAKESKSADFELSLTDGTEMVLPPSRLWVSIFPSNREITWK